MQCWINILPFLAIVADAGRVGFQVASTSSAAAGRVGFKPLTTRFAGNVAPVQTSTTTNTGPARAGFGAPQVTTTSSTSSSSTTSSSTTMSTSTTTTLQKVTTTSSAPSCTSALPTYGCLPLTDQEYFIGRMLDQHNTYRMRHNAPNMTWNADLVPAALANAQNNAQNNVFVHTSNGQYGENIAYQYGYNNPEYLGFLWYDEEKQYNFQTGGFSDATGHFTQLVWLASTQLGCAYVQASNTLSNNGYYYLTCEYSPPGNYYGQYQQEVLPPNSQPYPTQPPQWL